MSDRYDRQLMLDDMLMQSLVRRAIDNAINVDKDPDKYFKYLDINEMMKVQAISNYTMKNKLELCSKGFSMYKIKEHIDYLHEQQRKQKEKEQERIVNSANAGGNREDKFELAEHLKLIEQKFGKLSDLE